MSASFEQQREMIATFRSVVHSLFTVPEPFLMKDLDGGLIRSRVTTILNKLVDVSVLTGASELVKEGRPNQLAWRFVDATAKEFLAKMVRDDAQISRLLWPDEEPDLGLPTLEKALDSALAAPPVEEESAAPQDPVSLVAAVLEGFNDRIAGMEKRTEDVDAKLDLVVGGMAELIGVVSKVAAREPQKVYDDTELLLTIHELKDQITKAQQASQELQIAQLMKELAQVTVDVKYALEMLFKEGVQARNTEMMDGLETLSKLVVRQTEAFKNWWAPAMEQCLKGLEATNNNTLSVGEEITAMQSAVVQSLNAITKGMGIGIIGKRGEPPPLEPLPDLTKSAGTFRAATQAVALGLRRGKRGLPSLSQMLEKKDQEKEDKLPETLQHLVGEIRGDEMQLSLRRQELAAQREEIEADIEDKTKEIDKLKAELTEEERALLDKKEAKMRAEAKKGG
jgi:hypothetical protein